jgi:hypothetical protein
MKVIKTKVNIPRPYVMLDEFGSLFRPFGLFAPKD